MAGTEWAGTERLIVQPRDREFLLELATMRVVDHAQARLVAGFGSTSRTNKRLLKLVRAGLLRRFFLGSGGGRKALYALSEKGAFLANVPLRGPRRAQGVLVAADYFVEHQLQVNAIYLTAKFGANSHIRIGRWIAFNKPVAPAIKLIPDGYVEFLTPTGTLAAFVEVDLGNESLAIWREKTRKYVELALSGEYRRIFGHDRFRVLVIANSGRRMLSLRKTIAAITEKIFRFGTFEDARTRFFSSVWLRPVGPEPETLFEQPQ